MPRLSSLPYAVAFVAHSLVLAGSAAAAEVRLEFANEVVQVTIDGKPFTAYNIGHDLPKPFFSPVQSEGGTIISRPLENPEDHPHHKGIWLSVDEVNGVAFWAEKGKIQNESVELLTPVGDPAKMRVVNHWLGEDGKPILVENTTISIFANRLIAYDIQFEPGSSPVTFGDTKEGLFGIRVANSLREKEGGHVVNAEGAQGTANCWGKTSNWVDYYGTVDGSTHGVTIIDHPMNPRRSRYHVRDYGLFTISPFGTNAYTLGQEPAQPLTIESGGNLRLRFALYVHPGDTQAAKVPEVYEYYLKNS